MASTGSNVSPNSRSRARVAGSGFTIFTWNSAPIAFAQQVSHTSAQGVGTGPVAIQPMDEPYPVQIVTPAAAGMGTLVLRLYELYGAQVWERLGAQFNAGATPGDAPNITQRFDPQTNTALAGAVDLVDIFIRVAASAPITVVKYIRPPTLHNRNLKPYTQEFHNVVITNVQDSEEVNVGSMEVLKDITVAYTHTTRSGAQGSGRKSLAWDLRDRPLGSVASIAGGSLAEKTSFS